MPAGRAPDLQYNEERLYERMVELPFRQVHLDFHTSPWIKSVGADFDPEEFVAELKRARVNSVTVFAKCHHGMSYYPTQIGVIHPELQRDLMGEMIKACHAAGIRAPIYLSVCWDEYIAATHAEWRQVDPRTGRFVGAGPREAGWRWLCLNTPYRHYVLAQVREICRSYPVDGFFFDIIMHVEPGCMCNDCVRDMQEMHLDPGNDDHLRWFTNHVTRHFMWLAQMAVEDHHPEATLFFNSRLRIDDVPEAGMPGEEKYYTHWEIESLPSGQWGYNHYPLFARYFQTKNKPMLGMTGRFHRSWGDFGGLKSPAALEYECFRMLATGARCSIGDQLHPRGRLDKATYDLIGQVYRQVESVEPWCVDTEGLAEIGVLAWPIGKGTDASPGGVNAQSALEGAMRILLETHHQFHVLDRSADYDQYKVLIAPDVILFDDELALKVREYLSHGGALIMSYESGLDPARKAFVLDEIGLRYWGEAEYRPSYMGFEGLDGPVSRDIPPLAHVVYEPGTRVSLQQGTATLVPEVEPYFNRTWDHFCSHAQTPPRRSGKAPMVTRCGNVIYIARPIFNEYKKHANRVYRLLVRNLISMFLEEPLIRSSAPTGAEITLLRQKAEGNRPERHLVHLLYYPRERRGENLDAVEDIVPLHNIELAVRLPGPFKRVYLVPQGTDLAVQNEGSYSRVVVPEIRGHQIVAFEQSEAGPYPQQK